MYHQLVHNLFQSVEKDRLGSANQLSDNSEAHVHEDVLSQFDTLLNIYPRGTWCHETIESVVDKWKQKLTHDEERCLG